MTAVLIVGCGDIGQRVGQIESKRAHRVTGLVRTQECIQILQAGGIHYLNANLDEPESLGDLDDADIAEAVVYYFAPPPPSGRYDTRVSNFVRVLAEKPVPRKVIYISTTGVYGDCQGAWVNEETPVNPQTDRARRRLDAEQIWQRWEEQTRVPLVILRVAGIYGPQRLPIERIASGQPVLADGSYHPYSNRIHAEDLTRICVAAADTGHGIYNVSDGRPSTMADYFNAIADTFGLPRPPTITLEEARHKFNKEMLSYLEESRRIDNRKMQRDLQVSLLYPELLAGLQACKQDLDRSRPGTNW